MPIRKPRKTRPAWSGKVEGTILPNMMGRLFQPYILFQVFAVRHVDYRIPSAQEGLSNSATLRQFLPRQMLGDVFD